jgi:hypothetical protein
MNQQKNKEKKMSKKTNNLKKAKEPLRKRRNQKHLWKKEQMKVMKVPA